MLSHKHISILISLTVTLVAQNTHGVEISLVPESAITNHIINGNEITVSIGATTITLELWISNWDTSHSGNPLLRAYQATIDSSGFTNDSAGTLSIAAIPCIVDSDCFGTSTCGVQIAGFCDNVIGQDHAAAYIDTDNPAFLYSGVEHIAAVKTNTSDIAYGGLALDSNDSMADSGASRYTGTLKLDVPDDAFGTYTVGFLEGYPDSFFIDDHSIEIVPNSFFPVIINVINDCNFNGIDDDEDIAGGTSGDCNLNGIPDDCESDCNDNHILDECDILEGTSEDCDNNQIPDECESDDCNQNGHLDACDTIFGTSDDCNQNMIPDECEDSDCNDNGVIDVCDITSGFSEDCNENDIPDECESIDCNHNGIFDACDITQGTSQDVNSNLVPDECESARIFLTPIHATTGHIIRSGEIILPPGGSTITLEVRITDWDQNLDNNPLLRAYQAIIDSVSLTSGDSGSLSIAKIPCNNDSDCRGTATCGNNVEGICDVIQGQDHPSIFVDENHPTFIFRDVIEHIVIAGENFTNHDIQLAGLPINGAESIADIGVPQYVGTFMLDVSEDALGTFTLGFLDMLYSVLLNNEEELIEPLYLIPALITVTDDCNSNGIPDSDEIAVGSSQDCNANQFPDECDIQYEVSSDCNQNTIPDECEFEDCNDNTIADSCDILSGTSTDSNHNDIPDECDLQNPFLFAKGGRYLLLSPGVYSTPFSIQITSVDLPCLLQYITLDQSLGRIVDNPTFLTGEEWGIILISDFEIVPSTTYTIKIILENNDIANTFTITTPAWADVVEPFGRADIQDVLAIVNRWLGSTVLTIEATDFSPTVPNQKTDIDDVLSAVKAWLGSSFPVHPCP